MSARVLLGPRSAKLSSMRVVIADDELLLREGMAQLLSERGFEVIGTAGDGAELISKVVGLRPDVAIVDIRMPPTRTVEGIEATEELSERCPEVGVLILSNHVDGRHAMRLLEGRTQGIGYMLKDRVADLDRFVESLRAVASGGCAVDPEVVRALVERRRREDPLAELTEREREMLSLMAEGLSNGGIGRRLFLSERTVETHVHSIFMKLDIPREPDDNRRVLAVVRYLNAN